MFDKTLDVILAEKVIEHGFRASRTGDINKAKQSLKTFVTLAQPTISNEQFSELSRLLYSKEDNSIFDFFKKIFKSKLELKKKDPIIRISDDMKSAVKIIETTLTSIENGTLRVKNEPIHVPNYEFSLIPGDTDGREMTRNLNEWVKTYNKVTTLWKKFEDYLKSVDGQLGVNYAEGDEEKEKQTILKLFGNKKVIGLFDEIASVLSLDVNRNHKWVSLDGILVLDDQTHPNKSVLDTYFFNFRQIDKYTPYKLTTETYIDPFQEKDVVFILNEISDILKDFINGRFDKTDGYDLEFEETPLRDDEDYFEFIITNAVFILYILDGDDSFGAELSYELFEDSVVRFITPYFNAAILSLEPNQD